MQRWWILDTSLLLGGKEPPPGGRWVTTLDAGAEVSPGGRDAARFARWREAGLRVLEPGPGARRRVEEAAAAAGNLRRLSAADVGLLALALELEGVLVSDDHTVLDVAGRLGVEVRTVSTEGPTRRMDWRPRCAGCGRWFLGEDPGLECPVCGHAVRPRPWPPRRPDKEKA